MSAAAQAPADLLVAKAQDRSALIGIVGLGYVGLPLAMEFARAGFRVLGFDVSQVVVDSLTQGRDRKSTRLNSSHGYISYAVFCLKKKTSPWRTRTPSPQTAVP